MDLASPSGGILPGVHSKLMLVLGESDEPRSGRKLAERARVSHSSAQRVLSRWAELGLVERTDAGNASLFVLNRDHVAAASFLGLVMLRAELFGRIRWTVENWNIRPEFVSVFGSAARGDASSKSDIDMLVVSEWEELSEEWNDQLETLRQDVYRWSGNHLAILHATPEQLSQMDSAPRSTWASIQDDQIVIYGRSNQLRGDR